MTWWEALLLGVVQGITEFFPVSSSGHLVMTQSLLGLRLPGIGFEVAVHVATLLSVLVVYRERVARLAVGAVRGEREAWEYVGWLVVATLPAIFVVLAVGDWMEARFDDPAFAGTMLLVTGCFLWSTRWARGRPVTALELAPIAVSLVISLVAGTAVAFVGVLGIFAVVMGGARLLARNTAESQRVGWGGAIIMGVAQSVAIFPGISRSGSTVVTALWKRIDPLVAAEFSFLMSVVAILGAAVRSVPELMETGLAVEPLPMAIGFIAAAVSGVVAIRFFVEMLRRQNFYVFSWYCWAAGALFLFYVRSGGA
jgi:undecaprenyl-diphosphatase